MSAEMPASSAPAATLPELEPVAVEGCGVCAALVEQREGYRRLSNAARVNDCNDELANHPHHKRTKMAAR